MKKVDAIGDAVFNHHAFGIAFDERRGGTTYLIGQKEGRLFMAQVGDRQLANGTVIVFEMDCFVQNPRSAVRSRDVGQIDSSPCGSGYVGNGGEHLVGTAPEGNEVNASLVQPVEVGISGELRVKNELVWHLASPLLPIGDKLENLVIVLRLRIPRIPATQSMGRLPLNPRE